MWTNLKANRISLHPTSHLLPIHHMLPSLFSPSATSPPSTPFSIPHPKTPLHPIPPKPNKSRTKNLAHMSNCNSDPTSMVTVVPKLCIHRPRRHK